MRLEVLTNKKQHGLTMISILDVYRVHKDIQATKRVHVTCPMKKRAQVNFKKLILQL